MLQKIKGMIQTVKSKITSTVYVPCSMSKITLYIIVVIIAIVFLGWLGFFISEKKNNSRIEALQAAYLSQQDKLLVLSQDRAATLKENAKLIESIGKLQHNNDIVIKEVSNSAYKEKINMPDTDIDNEWNKFMSGVRERNNKRR
jgi:hypothetical protein